MTTLRELLAALPHGEILVPGPSDATITAGYTSDLLSDVLGHAPPDSVWITIQAHRTSVAVAVSVGIRGILLAHSRVPPPEMIEAARTERIALARFPASQFELSWRVQEILSRDRPASG
jgi:hypothetical protein